MGPFLMVKITPLLPEPFPDLTTPYRIPEFRHRELVDRTFRTL